jgi:nucleotide-binding universal stress UspA family protein
MSRIDKSLIQYAGFWSKLTQAEQLYFLHIIPSLEQISDYIPEVGQAVDSGEPLDEVLRKKVEDVVASHLGENNGAQCEIAIGKPLEQLLRCMDVKQADFIAVGHKPLDEGSGVFSRNVMRKLQKGYVLVVPPDMPHKLSKIAVPIDFSEDSKLALRTAAEVAGNITGCEITVMNIYDLPNFNYGRIGRTRDEMLHMTQENVEEAMTKFVAEQIPDFKGTVKKSALAKREYSTGEHICRFALDEFADLIVMGAHGHSALERFFLGSATEKLLLFNQRMPTLIVKNS